MTTLYTTEREYDRGTMCASDSRKVKVLLEAKQLDDRVERLRARPSYPAIDPRPPLAASGGCG